MDHDRWMRIDGLFRQAVELPAGRRHAFLDELEAREPALRRPVEDLLRASDELGDFLETPVGEACSPPWDEVLSGVPGADGVEEEDRTGERVGPYRLVRRLGRGGMATVYLAERADGLWEQEVALKLIRRGLDTDDVVQRFLAERQILSSLRHPNIATLLDGGSTEDGLPYLVMQRVEGTPITQYCDDRRLTIDDRLALFCDVSRAVQHAHGRLIAHRDLKPSNILVTKAGRVKLLDFGIAKLLDPESDPRLSGLTRPGHRLLTPEYASPEQLAGRPITTASDLYQLGVLLYQLLCGRLPDRRDAPAAGANGLRGEGPHVTPPSRAIRAAAGSQGPATERLADRRATTPDRLKRRLRGDLDIIVDRALRLDPSERYDSAAALVEDIERHLESLPIRAGRRSRRYRLRKFLRRNRWVAPIVIAGLLGVGLYALTTTRQARALERERNVARAEAERADEIRRFMTGLFRSADPFAPVDTTRGRQITVADALEIGARRVRDELADRPALQADLFATISEVYASLGLGQPAVRLQREALARARETHGPGSPEATRHLRSLGRLLGDAATRDTAESLLRRALTRTRELYGARDTVYAGVLAELASLEAERGRHEEAARQLERAVGILEAVEPVPDRQLAGPLRSLADVYAKLNRPHDALAAGRRALAHVQGAYGADHPRTALAMVQLADTHDWLEEWARAVDLYRSAITVLERTLGESHPETINALNNLAVTLLNMGAPDEAEPVLRRIVDVRTRRLGEDHEDVGDALQNLAATLNALGERDEAEALLLRAHEIYQGVLEPGHYRIAFPLLTLSEIRLERRDFAGADTSAAEATRILREAFPDGHYARAVAECRWGRALAGLGRASEATPLLEGAATALLTAPRAGRHRAPCLEAAVTHLQALGASPERWTLFLDGLPAGRGASR